MNIDRIQAEHPQIDFTYLLKYGSSKLYRLPTSFDNAKSLWYEGSMMKVRVSNVYDPSKFWIVIKCEELEKFQNYLFRFYNDNFWYYRILVNEIQLNMYCVAFVDGGYYRGVIVRCPPSNFNGFSVRVLLFDYGIVSTVRAEFLYYLSESGYRPPQFAMRASLCGMAPHESDMWTSAQVSRFKKLVDDKLLMLMVKHVDFERRILDIYLADVDFESEKITQIHSILLAEKFAQKACIREGPADVELNVKYPYLFPSFETIESGLVPPNVFQSEFLMNIVSPHVLYKYCYRKISYIK